MQLFQFVCITFNYNNINNIPPYKTIVNNVRQNGAIYKDTNQ